MERREKREPVENGGEDGLICLVDIRCRPGNQRVVGEVINAPHRPANLRGKQRSKAEG